MTSLLYATRSRSLLGAPAGAVLPSEGAGAVARMVEQRLKSMRTLLTGAVHELTTVRDSHAKAESLEKVLREKAASLKRITGTVGMYLDPDWRAKLFARIDQLLDPEDWETDFRLPSEQSFSTFLRMIIYLHPTRRPGLGISPTTGNFLAAWMRGSDRIVIECFANDEVRWVLSREIEGERESGAGRVQIHRMPEVIAGYEPEMLFQDGDKLLA